MRQIEWREAKRREKLDLIERQIADGSLQVRQMTPEERTKYPKRDSHPSRRPRWGR